ncbi:phage baseplate protein [Salmonella enterica subsp. enterica]|nr:phage baseplate protein [Salmonella enterica subsp. enterica]
MDNNQFTPTNAQINDAESMAYAFEMLMSGYFFMEIAQVIEIRGEAPNLVVDVMPLLSRQNRSGSPINNSPIYDIPVWRLQRGSSAIIMDPLPGDIGLIAVCDRDTTLVRTNLKQSTAGSARRHNKADAIYMGGLLNQAPTQYIEFADNKLNIVAPFGIEVTTPLMHVTGNITAGGDITDNNGTQSASLKTLRDNYDLPKHPVAGVQSGSSTVTSNTTDKPV